MLQIGPQPARRMPGQGGLGEGPRRPHAMTMSACPAASSRRSPNSNSSSKTSGGKTANRRSEGQSDPLVVSHSTSAHFSAILICSEPSVSGLAGPLIRPVWARPVGLGSTLLAWWLGGQCGSTGGVSQPQVEARSVKIWVARATTGRASSARCRSAQPQRGTGDRTGRRVKVGGIGSAWRFGDSSTGRPKRATWSKNAGPVIPPSLILDTDAWFAAAKAEA